MRSHMIGLLLATEEDWPTAFENLLRRLGPVRWGGETHEFVTERIVHEPFDLRYKPRYQLIIDRLAWWYDVPREWLKKLALMDEVYLLNNPFTFQAMEKHSAYCALMRLGIKVPETWLIPHKLPPDNPRYIPMAERYSPEFDLDYVAEQVGYPLYMKPFDGGMWVGVTRIETSEELHRSYDESGERLMHLQAAVDDYDVFTRSLSIGPQTKVMEYDPSADGHYRYQVGDAFLSPELMHEVETIGRLVNAFFRWEFNSCEVIVKDGEAHPIDYANASPDMALVSLHYTSRGRSRRWRRGACSVRRPTARSACTSRHAITSRSATATFRTRRSSSATALSRTTISRRRRSPSSATRRCPTSRRRWSSTSRARSSTS